MEKMIAMCGLICSECPVFIATQNNDDEQRRKLAVEYSNHQQFQPEDINCFGCVSVSEHVCKFCVECEIRLCGLEKKHQTCAECPDFACETYDRHCAGSPNKQVLESLRAKL